MATPTPTRPHLQIVSLPGPSIYKPSQSVTTSNNKRGHEFERKQGGLYRGIGKKEIT